VGLVTSPCKTTHTTETTRGNHSGIQTSQGKRSLPPDNTEGGSITDVDQSREEVFISKRQISNAKNITKIGTWNVRTLYQCNGMAQVLREIQTYRLGVLGVSEMHWTKQGQFSSDGITVLYSGHNDQHIDGVRIFLGKEAASALIVWKPVRHRIITARPQTQQAKLTVIQVYAPTETAENSEKDEFYSQLQNTLDEILSYDIKLLTGDFNAQIDSDQRGQYVAVGPHGTAKKTIKNGERLTSLCVNNKLKIRNKFFQHTKKPGYHLAAIHEMKLTTSASTTDGTVTVRHSSISWCRCEYRPLSAGGQDQAQVEKECQEKNILSICSGKAEIPTNITQI